MSTCPFCQKKKDPCAFCEKPGLPILPLRYAVARADKGEAPRLSAPFGAGVNDVALPAKDAHYTLRLLRPGYLYLFNETRGTWNAYVVTEESYLYDFPAGKTPPDVSGAKFTCKKPGDAFLARCVNVQDADSTGNVWLGFSDTAWTPDVLKKHNDPGYRKAHMQRIDIATWLSGKRGMAHTAPIADLTSRVAEFAATTNAKCGQSTLLNVVNKVYARTSQFISALQEVQAFDFAPHRFVDASDQANELLAATSGACAIHQPMLLGLDDPVGIAMELNQLAIHRALEWTEEPERKWKFATATAIDGIREAVQNGAVQTESEARKNKDLATHAVFSIMAPATTRAMTRPDWQEHLGQISESDARKIGEKAWPNYQKMFNENARSKYLRDYAKDFKTLQADTIQSLDQAYLSWLKSASFKAYFMHNFDRYHAESGMAYQKTVFSCIHDATGRAAVVEHIKQCLGKDPTEPGEVVLRALVFNQNDAAKAWNEAAAEKGREDEGTFLENAEKLYGALKEIFGAEDSDAFKGALAGLSKYIYQLSAPVMERLNDAVAAGGARTVQFLLPEKRLLGLMQSMLTAQDANKVLFDARGLQTRKQAARALAGFLAQLTGQNDLQWRSSAREMLDDMSGGKTQSSPYRGLFVVDKSELATLQKATAAERMSAARASMEETTFGMLLKRNARFATSSEVIGSGLGLILTGFVLKNSFGEVMKAEGNAQIAKEVNFGAGATAAIGEVGRIAGNLFGKTAWGVTKVAKAVDNILLQVETRAGWLSGVGKLLGVVGGVVAGLVQIVEGWQAYKEGDVAFGIGTIVLGVATGGLAIAVFLSATPGVGLVLVLILIAAGYLVALFKHDKLQHWLDASCFGFHQLGKTFANQDEQDRAYGALAKGV